METTVQVHRCIGISVSRKSFPENNGLAPFFTADIVVEDEDGNKVVFQIFSKNQLSIVEVES